MRIAPTILLAPLLLSAACMDTPITPAHLGDNGKLRNHNWEQSLISAEAMRPTTHRASRLALTAVLAAEDGGALEDRAVFTHSIGEVFLHMRADGLDRPREVTFVWSYGDQQRTTTGFLHPSQTVSLASSHTIKAGQLGDWRVEVFETGLAGATLLYERGFKVTADKG